MICMQITQQPDIKQQRSKLLQQHFL